MTTADKICMWAGFIGVMGILAFGFFLFIKVAIKDWKDGQL